MQINHAQRDSFCKVQVEKAMPVLMHFWLIFYLIGYSFAQASSAAGTTTSSASHNSLRVILSWEPSQTKGPAPWQDLTLLIPLGARLFFAWQSVKPWGRGTPDGCVLEEADRISCGEGVKTEICPQLFPSIP